MGSADANRKKRRNTHADAVAATAGGIYHGDPIPVLVRERTPAETLRDAQHAASEAGRPALTVTEADVQAARDRLDAARAVGAATARTRAADRQEATERRDAGMRRAEVNASSWNLLADEAIRRTAEALDYFDADDVWDVGGLDTTMENRALGPAIKRAQKAGWCEPTDRFRTSRQPQCHGMPRRVWRSLIRGE